MLFQIDSAGSTISLSACPVLRRDAPERSKLMPYPPAHSATLPRCAARANSFGLPPWVQCRYFSSRPSPFPNPSFFPSSQQCFGRPGLSTKTRRIPFVARPSSGNLKNFPVLLCQTRPFSSTDVAMAAERIDGTQIAKDIRAGLKGEIQKIQDINPRFKPSLVIFQGM